MAKITAGTALAIEPADDDVFPIVDVSEALDVNKRKKITWATIKAIFALAAKGVTNGDSHDHSGGDGGQIAHSSLSGIDPASSVHVTNGDSHNHLGGDGGQIAHSSLSGITPSWTDVDTFANSWVNYENNFYDLSYCTDALGFVHFRGVISSGTLDAAAFVLPVAIRPSANLNISSVCSGELCAILQFTTGGNVVVYAASNTWVSFDNVHYYVGL